MAGNGSSDWDDPTPPDNTPLPRILPDAVHAVVMAIDSWRQENIRLTGALTALREDIIANSDKHVAYWEERLISEKREHAARMLVQIDDDEKRVRTRDGG